MELVRLQAAFMQELQSPHRSRACNPALAAEIFPAERLSIYRSNSAGACHRALELIYPVCRTIVGNAFFRHLGARYISRYPSRLFDLNHYGEHWPQFLHHSLKTGAALRELPYLAELAQLEWHYHAAYYAADDPAFDFTALQRVEETRQNDIIWQSSASLSLIHTDFPLCAIWQANQKSSTTASGVSGLSEREYLCIHRHQFTLQLMRVDRLSHQLLQKIVENKTMGELVEQFGSTVEERLPRWVTSGWICGFRLVPSPPSPCVRMDVSQLKARLPFP